MEKIMFKLNKEFKNISEKYFNEKIYNFDDVNANSSEGENQFIEENYSEDEASLEFPVYELKFIACGDQIVFSKEINNVNIKFEELSDLIDILKERLDEDFDLNEYCLEKNFENVEVTITGKLVSGEELIVNFICSFEDEENIDDFEQELEDFIIKN